MIFLDNELTPEIKKGSAITAEPLFYMVHSGGFEPPTARFVAEYSIQLSYECFVEARILLVRQQCVKH